MVFYYLSYIMLNLLIYNLSFQIPTNELQHVLPSSYCDTGMKSTYPCPHVFLKDYSFILAVHEVPTGPHMESVKLKCIDASKREVERNV